MWRRFRSDPREPVGSGEGMKEPRPKDVDAYVAASAGEARPLLAGLRELVRSAVPDAEEAISWGVPFYRYHGPLGGFAAYKRHVSFGLGGLDLQSEDRGALEEQGYRTGKKTVQIAFDQELPTAALTRMLEAQAKTNATSVRKGAGD